MNTKQKFFLMMAVSFSNIVLGMDTAKVDDPRKPSSSLQLFNAEGKKGVGTNSSKEALAKVQAEARRVREEREDALKEVTRLRDLLATQEQAAQKQQADHAAKVTDLERSLADSNKALAILTAGLNRIMKK